MSRVDACPEHGEKTRRRDLRYCFSLKHHGGSRKDAQWADDLSHEEEFAIFDEADFREISDDAGNLYGLRRDEESNLLDLGTRGEQIAKFWENGLDQPWHGFPLFPLLGTDVKQNQRNTPAPRSALLKMEQAGLIQAIERKRLQKGYRG